MSSVHKLPSTSAETTSPQVESLVRGILALLEPLSLADKQIVVQRITDALTPIRTPNAGDVLAAVIHFMPRNQPWTVDDIKRNIEQSGIEAKPKEVYNAIGYLTRKKHIQRISYGRYIVDGVPIETSEDLGADLRYEEAYKE